MLVLRGFSVGDACLFKVSLMMLASGVDADSAGGGLLGMETNITNTVKTEKKTHKRIQPTHVGIHNGLKLKPFWTTVGVLMDPMVAIKTPLKKSNAV